MQKDKLGHGGGGGGRGGAPPKKFLFPICRIAETEFSTYIFNWYLSNVKNLFADNSRA